MLNENADTTIIIPMGNQGVNPVSGEVVILGEKLWLTEDGTEAVPDGDPRARFLLGIKGAEVSIESAIACGLIEDDTIKSRRPKRNKMHKPTENKGDDLL